jgi:hypothetical protein
MSRELRITVAAAALALASISVAGSASAGFSGEGGSGWFGRGGEVFISGAERVAARSDRGVAAHVIGKPHL